MDNNQSSESKKQKQTKATWEATVASCINDIFPEQTIEAIHTALKITKTETIISQSGEQRNIVESYALDILNYIYKGNGNLSPEDAIRVYRSVFKYKIQSLLTLELQNRFSMINSVFKNTIIQSYSKLSMMVYGQSIPNKNINDAINLHYTKEVDQYLEDKIKTIISNIETNIEDTTKFELKDWIKTGELAISALSVAHGNIFALPHVATSGNALVQNHRNKSKKFKINLVNDIYSTVDKAINLYNKNLDKVFLDQKYYFLENYQLMTSEILVKCYPFETEDANKKMTIIATIAGIMLLAFFAVYLLTSYTGTTNSSQLTDNTQPIITPTKTDVQNNNLKQTPNANNATKSDPEDVEETTQMLNDLIIDDTNDKNNTKKKSK